jgi:putative tricarboxylic transport membrane protein
MLLANLLYLVLGLGFAKVFARISLIPAPYLWPAVFVLSVIGAYAPNQAMAEVWVAIAFGFIGFFMRRYGFSPAPLVMGLVLGKMVEETLKQSLIIFDQNWLLFFSRPIVVALFAVTFLSVFTPLAARAVRKAFRRARPLNPVEE